MERRTGRTRGLTPDGQKIQELREDEAGLSRTQLAHAAGISADFVMRIELYNKRISKVTGTRIARTLSVTREVTRDEIIAGSGDGTGSDAEPEALAS